MKQIPNYQIGDVIDVDFPPVWNGSGLAGTHPGVVIALIGEDALLLPCTSNLRRGDGTVIERRVTGLRHDTVILHQVRALDIHLLNRGRYLLTLPRNIVHDLKRQVRHQLKLRIPAPLGL